MKLKRAQEIINSTDKIDVFYKNSPVWIEDVNSNKDNADITILDNKTRMNVPVWDLDER
ncbi:MAG: H-type small acid-soluble spore protein [Lutisporaceae bacterium]